MNGLGYIHSTLDISYGLVDGENIRLDSRANAKLGELASIEQTSIFADSTIANIGESMLARARNTQDDLSDLGALASKLYAISSKDIDKHGGNNSHGRAIVSSKDRLPIAFTYQNTLHLRMYVYRQEQVETSRQNR